MKINSKGECFVCFFLFVLSLVKFGVFLGELFGVYFRLLFPKAVVVSLRLCKSTSCTLQYFLCAFRLFFLKLADVSNGSVLFLVISHIRLQFRNCVLFWVFVFTFQRFLQISQFREDTLCFLDLLNLKLSDLPDEHIDCAGLPASNLLSLLDRHQLLQSRFNLFAFATHHCFIDKFTQLFDHPSRFGQPAVVRVFLVFQELVCTILLYFFGTPVNQLFQISVLKQNRLAQKFVIALHILSFKVNLEVIYVASG